MCTVLIVANFYTFTICASCMQLQWICFKWNAWLFTSPMRGRGSSNHCVCVCVCLCVSVTAPASATNALKAKVRYQQKALDAGNKINVGIKLKFSVRKLWQLLAYHEIFSWRLRQEIDASRSVVLLEDYWYVKRCVYICKLHKLNWQLYTAIHSYVLIVPCTCTLRNRYVITLFILSMTQDLRSQSENVGCRVPKQL